MQAAPAEVINTSGAGDSLVAGCILGLLQRRSAAAAVAIGLVRLALYHGFPMVMLADALRFVRQVD